ncbi:MAG: anaerobic sulfatase maturase, partial [Candidatus Dormibacteria bacterium]
IEASPGPLVYFAWHGGEPTLAGLGFFRRVVELQQRLLPEGWSCLNNLQTNGTRLDGEWAAFLAEQGFAVGISIDGPARLHDRSRPDRHGLPSHARTMHGLARLRDHGVEPDVLCTLNARTASAPLEVYRFFLAEGVRWVQFLPVVERAGGGAVTERSVSPAAMSAFLRAIFDEWVRHDVGRIAVQNFAEALQVVSGEPANLCIMSETCGRVLALEHDGGVYACDHFVDPAHRLGNVTTDGLAALVESPAQIAFGQAKKDGLPGQCRACPVLFLCNGGCPKDRFAITSEGEPGLNFLCGGYRELYAHMIPHLQRMVALGRSGKGVAAIMVELEIAEREARRRWRSTSRNDPCPCGSGRKYKHCCLDRQR